LYKNDRQNPPYKLQSSLSLDYQDYDWFREAIGEQDYRTLAISTNNDSSWSNQITIKQEPRLLIPTAFSPNGDNLNDKWEVLAPGCKSVKIRIVSRWYTEIYQSEGTTRVSWDGNHKNETVQNGGYMYEVEAITYEGKVLKERGILIVTR
jgi:gliding motility-associated-like protein